jgi:chromosome segregation ATPase
VKKGTDLVSYPGSLQVLETTMSTRKPTTQEYKDLQENTMTLNGKTLQEYSKPDSYYDDLIQRNLELISANKKIIAKYELSKVQYDESKNTLHFFQNRCDDVQNKCHEVSAAHETLKAHHEDLKSRCEREKLEHAYLRKEHDELKVKDDGLKGKLTDVQDTLNCTEADYAELSAVHDDLCDKLGDVQDMLNSAKANYTELQAIHKDCDRTLSAYEALKADHEHLQQRHENTARKCEGLQDELTAVIAKREIVDTKNQRLVIQFEKKSAEYEELDKSHTNLKDNYNDALVDIKILKVEHQCLVQNSGETLVKCKNLEAAHGELGRRIERADALVEESKVVIAAKDQSLAAWKSDFHAMEKMYQDSLTTTTELTTRISNMDVKLDYARTEVDRSNKKLHNLDDQYARLSMKYEAASEQIKELETKINLKDDKLAQLQTEHDAAIEQQKADLGMIQSLGRDTEVMGAVIQDLRAKLSDADHEWDIVAQDEPALKEAILVD